MLTGGSAGIKEFITPVCNTLNSWLGDLAGLALNFTPVGAIITAATYLITNSPPFQEMMAGLFENLAGKIVNGAIANEDFGNAFGVSAVLGIGEGGNAGAMMPMTVDQAVAYSRATQENRIANAKIDQATHSPFDTTNPNTFSEASRVSFFHTTAQSLLVLSARSAHSQKLSAQRLVLSSHPTLLQMRTLPPMI